MYLSAHTLHPLVIFLFLPLLSTLCRGDGIGSLTTYSGNTCSSTTSNSTFYASQLSLCQHITDSSGFYYITHQFQITNNLCAVTVYSDMYCSDDGVVINANTCTHSSAGIQSWSVDCSPGDAGYSSAKSGATTADAIPATSSPAVFTSHTGPSIASMVSSTATSAIQSGSSVTQPTFQSSNNPSSTASLTSANSSPTSTATPPTSSINTSLIGQIVGPVLGALSAIISLVIFLMKRRDKQRKKAAAESASGSEHGEVSLLSRPPYTDDDEAARIQMKSLATTDNNDVR